MTPARVQFRGDQGRPVVLLSGEIDASNAQSLRERIAGAVGNQADGVVLDLSAVTYLDSSGLRLVFSLARDLRDRHQDLALVVPRSSRVRRPLDLGGVSTVARVVHDLVELDEPVRGLQVGVEGA